MPSAVSDLRTSPVNRSRIGAMTVGALLICVALGWGAVQESFWWDDYEVLDSVRSGDGELFSFVIASGRPVSAVLQTLGFEIATSPQQGWILRLIGLSGVLATFLLLSFRWLRMPRGGLLIAAASISFCLPPFQVYSYWAVAWEFSWSLLLSVLALFAWERKSIPLRLVSIALVAVALLNYPPASLMLFAVIAVEAAAFRQTNRDVFRRTVGAVIPVALGGILSLVAAFGIARLLDVPPTARVGFVRIPDIPEKILWLITQPIAQGLRPFLVDAFWTRDTYLTIIPATVVLVLAVVIQARGMRESAIVRSVVLALPLAMTLGPLIIIQENYLEYRFIPGYTWAIATLIAFACFTALQRALRSGPVFSWRRIGPFGIAAVAIGVTITFAAVSTLTNDRFDKLIKEPYDAKTIFLSSELASCERQGKTSRVLIVNTQERYPYRSWASPIGPGIGLGGFSIISDIDQDSVPVPNVRLLLNRDIPVDRTAHDSPEVKAAGREPRTCVIQLDDLKAQFVGSAPTS